MCELYYWWDLLEVGGMMGFHDTNWEDGRCDVWCGKSYAPVDEVKAPPGYAVGSVVWGGSTFCEYVDLTYMKIGDRELLAGDAYKANRVGSQKGNIDVATSFSGDGTPVIGITGRLDTTRLAFGLIFLSDTDAKTASRQGKNTSAP